MGGNVLINVAKVTLLLVNMAFMAGGAMLVYFSHRVKTSGWLDVFQGEYDWVGTSTFLMTLIVGAVVMALSALGCFGALLRQKLLLTMYAVILIVALGFFVVIAIGAHSVYAKATEWADADYPAVASETIVGDNFNRLYCASQVPYYCVDAGVNDVLAMFNESMPGTFSSTTTNFSSFCGVMNVPQVETVCQVCQLAAQYDEYSAVFDWAEETCPRNAKNQVWCGALLVASGNATSQGNAVANNAPYGQCRPVFFNLVTKWSSFLLGCSIGVCLAMGFVLGLTILLRCYRGSDDDDDGAGGGHAGKDVRYSAAYNRANQRRANQQQLEQPQQPQNRRSGQQQQQAYSYDQQHGQQQQHGGDAKLHQQPPDSYDHQQHGQQQYAYDQHDQQQYAYDQHGQQQYGYDQQQYGQQHTTDHSGFTSNDHHLQQNQNQNQNHRHGYNDHHHQQQQQPRKFSSSNNERCGCLSLTPLYAASHPLVLTPPSPFPPSLLLFLYLSSGGHHSASGNHFFI